jgi:hypothetical protein
MQHKLNEAGFENVEIITERKHFKGTYEQYINIALRAFQIKPNAQQKFLEIYGTKAKELLANNKAYTEAHVAIAIK